MFHRNVNVATSSAQTKPASVASIASSLTPRLAVRRVLAAGIKPVIVATLLWLATAAGEIPVPGTPTPITLQTFVLMMAGLTMTWRQAGSAVMLYLLAGAAGLPVFAGGMSGTALVGPNAGFLLGFLPGIVVTALIAATGTHTGKHDFASPRCAQVPANFLRRLARNLAAALIGCVGVVYLTGFAMQAILTHTSLLVVVAAGAAFLLGDLLKAAVAALVATTAARLR